MDGNGGKPSSDGRNKAKRRTYMYARHTRIHEYIPLHDMHTYIHTYCGAQQMDEMEENHPPMVELKQSVTAAVIQAGFLNISYVCVFDDDEEEDDDDDSYLVVE